MIAHVKLILCELGDRPNKCMHITNWRSGNDK